MPPLSPNELALLAGIVVVFVAWRIVLGEFSWRLGASAVIALGIVWATGSRTALLMLLVALAVMAMHVRRARVGLVVGGLILGGVGAIMALTTGVLSGFLQRDGAGVSTLESRFVAWDAASTWADSLWQLVFGGGLSVEIIQVQGQWWIEQPLDSSWVSLLVQTGVLGLVVSAGWVIWVLRGVLRAPRAYRALFFGLSGVLRGPQTRRERAVRRDPGLPRVLRAVTARRGRHPGAAAREDHPAAARTVARPPLDGPSAAAGAGGAGRRAGRTRPALTAPPAHCGRRSCEVSGRAAGPPSPCARCPGRRAGCRWRRRRRRAPRWW